MRQMRIFEHFQGNGHVQFDGDAFVSFHIVILLGICKASMPVKLHLNVFHYDYHTRQPNICLCDKGRGGSALVPPGRGEGTDGLVVTGETVNTGFDENETELAVLVLAVGLEVLADGDSLLDKHVEVLRDIGAQAVRLEDAEDLVSGNDLDLSNAVAVPEDLTNLGRSSTLLCETADLLNDLLGGGLQPSRRAAGVRDGGG